MNILVLGSGGREHALSWKIAQSNRCKKIFVAPGNPGTAEFAQNISINPNKFDQIAFFAQKEKIELIVVGPEDPLVNGIHDYFLERPELASIKIIGPVLAGAMLEGSKEYAKDFMKRHQIPTAAYLSVKPENIAEGLEFLKKLESPYVLKADGLAAGKGVLICEHLHEASDVLQEMLDGKFGQASKTVVIEEFLKGIELSVFILTDGTDYLLLPEAKDYKRIGEGDTGLNTGGMGAISPVSFANASFLRKVKQQIIEPTLKGLQQEGISYQGFIFFGLMKVEDEPYVIEYNVRLGDPETEAIIPRIESDFLAHLQACANKNLKQETIKIMADTCATVVLVSKGYPELYEKGKSIFIDRKLPRSIVFHAGTTIQNEELVSNGGRVLAISSLAENLEKALTISYQQTDQISFEGKTYRKDIGNDLLKL